MLFSKITGVARQNYCFKWPPNKHDITCFLDKNQNKSNAMCDHAHIQLEKEYSNTDFICSTTCVAVGKRIFQAVT